MELCRRPLMRFTGIKLRELGAGAAGDVHLQRHERIRRILLEELIMMLGEARIELPDRHVDTRAAASKGVPARSEFACNRISNDVGHAFGRADRRYLAAI